MFESRGLGTYFGLILDPVDSSYQMLIFLSPDPLFPLAITLILP